MKRIICLVLAGAIPVTLASCSKEEPVQETSEQIIQTETTAPVSSETSETETENDSLDYLVLVNKLNMLPDGWDEELVMVTGANSDGDTVEVEKKTYDAYLRLKDDLEKNDGIYIDLDSGYRSVAEQQEIMDSFTEKYGADYAARMVARPGCSEHHTGLAIDIYFRLKNDDGTFTNVNLNEDMVEYPEIWEKIHAKLAGCGFILRYPEGREHITGYGYEPWHFRYVGSAYDARFIMTNDITLEEYLGAVKSAPVTVDIGSSDIYSDDELYEAVVQIKCRFASWGGCELHAIRYDGDEADNGDNLEWLNAVNGGTEYVDVAKFVIDFHSPEMGNISWNPDEEYTDYEFWLARTEYGGWDIAFIGEYE
ncbi:MAG: M15 family metallopeptidase [Clostridiales bacterium]|nr:M15 family metallopeptidase [Clostridiales bacterium]